MSRVIVASFDAVGGPSQKIKETDGFWAGPTDAGEYRVSHCGKHSSPSYPESSKIRWGSELREVEGELQVKHDGKWRAMKDVVPSVTKERIMKTYLQLYGKFELPPTWVFNDFGHMTCYFYKDLNGNRRFDKDVETIHKEYFHPTSQNEAEEAAGKPVALAPSHGCIHIKPRDMDAMVAAGYFAAGNLVVVHRYSDDLPKLRTDPAATRPFRVHFYPGRERVLVTGSVQPPARKR